MPKRKQSEPEGPPVQVFLMHNGMWAVFNARGEQLAEYQGPDSYVLRERLAHAYTGAVEMANGELIAYPGWLILPIQGSHLVTGLHQRASYHA